MGITEMSPGNGKTSSGCYTSFWSSQSDGAGLKGVAMTAMTISIPGLLELDS